jgi:zinc protease
MTDIFKTTLDNGLTVVLQEMHHAPVASLFVWYRVGSRQEQPGLTGLSHWVEHMMFKGTPTFPQGTLSQLVMRHGGRRNAFTSQDYTAYYETLVSDQIELALQLESDRMVNTIMTAEETERERTVILSERHMSENRPQFLLSEARMQLAFGDHGYKHMVLGEEADLKRIARDDLYGYYKQHYAPNNAIVVAVGDFDRDWMLGKVETYFGALGQGEKDTSLQPFTPQPQPTFTTEQRLTVTGPGSTRYLQVSYPAPPATHPDYLPLSLLSIALTAGRSARFYKALVTGEVANTVSSGFGATIEPHLFTFTLVPRQAIDLATLEAALDDQLAGLATMPMTETELQKAKKRALVAWSRGRESVTSQARSLGYAEVVAGGYEWWEERPVRLAQVTIADLERVRETYFQPEKRVVAWYVPAEGDKVRG